MYKTINLTQGSDEWLLWRKLGIGGSEIPPLMGYTKYKTVLDLYQDRLTSKIVQNQTEATLHGNKHEESARIEFINQTGIFIEPMCLENIKKPHFRVSLDGINKERTLVAELKCPFTSWGHKKNINNISPEYKSQMQYQMLVSETEVNHFVSYYEGHFYRKEYTPDVKFQKEIIKRCNIFWEYVTSKKEPDLKYFNLFSFS